MQVVQGVRVDDVLEVVPVPPVIEIVQEVEEAGIAQEARARQPVDVERVRKTLHKLELDFEFAHARTRMLGRREKPKFAVRIVLHELANVPLVSGSAFVKWRLRSSSKADARGRTEKVVIREHKAVWEYERTFTHRFSFASGRTLAEETVVFEVLHEHGGRERVALGVLTLNLAGYTSAGEKEAKRYLLQSSKTNSTLRITIDLQQTGGEEDFTPVPPQHRTQIIGGGITNVLHDSKPDARRGEAESDPDPNFSSSSILERDYAQRIYRSTMAATWQLRSGELMPDQVVEEIFHGGDGWRKASPLEREEEEQNEIMVEDELPSLASWTIGAQ